MNKNTRTLLIVAGLAIAAYLAYRWYENRKNAGTTNSPTGALGTNLNSVAPELVGGSSGPEVGPALSTPVNITLNENIAPPPADQSGGPMLPANNQTLGAVNRQGLAASAQGPQSNSPATSTPENPGGVMQPGTQPGGPDIPFDPGGPMQGAPKTTVAVQQKKLPAKRTARPRPKGRPVKR